jgi:hypothetical protein
MKGIREYVSPDNELRFVVVYDEQDTSLGFEGLPWHTHAGVLASALGTSEELAVNRFVDDLLSDRCIADRREDTRRVDHCRSDCGSASQT